MQISFYIENIAENVEQSFMNSSMLNFKNRFLH